MREKSFHVTYKERLIKEMKEVMNRRDFFDLLGCSQKRFARLLSKFGSGARRDHDFFFFNQGNFDCSLLSIRPSSRRQEIYSGSCGLNRGATRGALILLDTTISDSVHASTGIFHEQYFDLSIMLEDSTIRCLDMI